MWHATVSSIAVATHDLTHPRAVADGRMGDHSPSMRGYPPNGRILASDMTGLRTEGIHFPGAEISSPELQ